MNCACNLGRDKLRLVPKLNRKATTPPRPHYTVRRRRFAAEKWAMPEDAPPT